jgi:heme exporter protein D
LLAIKKGAYGSGDWGLIESSSILPGLKLLVLAEPVFLAIQVLSWLVLVVLWIKWRRRGQGQRGQTANFQTAGNFFPCQSPLGVLLALCVAGLAQLLFAAKRPAPHYLLPALALMGTQAVVVCRLLSQAKWVWLAGSVTVLCAAVFAGSTIWQRRAELAGQRDALLSLTRDADKIAAPGRTVCYYRCSSPVYALNFGNEFCGRFFGAALAQDHPDALFYDPWKRGFSSFHGPVPREEILKLAAAGPLYFWGSAWETYAPEVRPPELRFQAKTAEAGEVIYEAVPQR